LGGLAPGSLVADILSAPRWSGERASASCLSHAARPPRRETPTAPPANRPARSTC